MLKDKRFLGNFYLKTSLTIWLISGRIILSKAVLQAFPEPGRVIIIVSLKTPAVARVRIAGVPIY